jgi:hypothetical protein
MNIATLVAISSGDSLRQFLVPSWVLDDVVTCLQSGQGDVERKERR